MAFLKKTLRKLGISAGALALVFVVAEVGARLLEPGPFALVDRNPYITHPEDERIARHRPSFEGRWDGTWYETDTHGLRGPELPGASPEQYRIVALGDSCTFGKGVREEDCWPRQLETQLGELFVHSPLRASTAVVANLGVNGYAGATYARIFEELGVQLHPDLVVVGFNLNDFPNSIRAVDDYVFNQRRARKLLSVELRDRLGRSAAYRWARQMYYHWNREKDWENAEEFARQARPDALDEPAWQEQVAYLTRIRNLAQEVDAHMAVFLFPYESQVYRDAFDRAPIERLRSACKQLEVPFVDLAEEFRRAARASHLPKELFLKGDRYHPNPHGYALVAEAVVSLILEQGWVQKGP